MYLDLRQRKLGKINGELNYLCCSPDTTEAIKLRRMGCVGHVTRMG
jgi:hypothetical protein